MDILKKVSLCQLLVVPSTKFVGLIEFEIWTIVWRNVNDVTMTSKRIRFFFFIKFNHKSTKCTSKRNTEFHLDRTYES